MHRSFSLLLFAASLSALLDSSALPNGLHRGVAHTGVGDSRHFGQLDICLAQSIAAAIHGGGVAGIIGAGGVLGHLLVGHVGAFVAHVFVVPSLLLQTPFLRLLLLGLFGEPQRHSLGQFGHLRHAVVETAQEAKIFDAVLDAFVVLVDEVKAADLFLLAGESG